MARQVSAPHFSFPVGKMAPENALHRLSRFEYCHFWLTLSVREARNNAIPHVILARRFSQMTGAGRNCSQ